MNGLLITNPDQAAAEEMAAQFADCGYQVTTVPSVANALEGILDKSLQVVLLCGTIDESYVAKFIPLLKKCNRDLSIILVADEMPLELVRRIRQEGIFYHALSPMENESWEEIRQVVACAFSNYQAQQVAGSRTWRKTLGLVGARGALTIIALLLMVPPASATVLSGWFGGHSLIQSFAAFCAVLLSLQLVPAVRVLLSPAGSSPASQASAAVSAERC